LALGRWRHFECAIDKVDIFQDQGATVIDNPRTIYDGVSDVVAVQSEFKAYGPEVKMLRGSIALIFISDPQE
jgi:hypothetical protein